MANQKIKIDIWSDIVCPFCYIGKRKLEKAIDQLNLNEQVDIVWHSYQLDPIIPQKKSFPSTQYLSETRGYPLEQLIPMRNQLTQNAKQYGLDFQFEQSLTFNTLDAHRLIQWAKSFDKSDALKEAFMKAYFTDGVDLSKEESLMKVVESVGLNGLKAKEVLQSNDYQLEVATDIRQAQSLGVRGVPFFVINEKEAIYGAQDDMVFEMTLRGAL